MNDVLCKHCNTKIGSMNDRIVMTKHGQLASSFVNPHGVSHDLLTLSRLDVTPVRMGRPVARDSWFAGYAWTIINCVDCFEHLGWMFSLVGATNADGDPIQQQQQQQQQQQEAAEENVIDEDTPLLAHAQRREANEDEEADFDFDDDDDDDIDDDEDDDDDHTAEELHDEKNIVVSESRPLVFFGLTHASVYLRSQLQNDDFESAE